MGTPAESHCSCTAREELSPHNCGRSSEERDCHGRRRLKTRDDWSQRRRRTVPPMLTRKKKCKWNSPVGGVVGHTKDGEIIGALDVEDEAVLRVGGVAVVGAEDLLEDLLEDLAGDGVGVGGSGSELSQDHRRVKDRHPQRSLSSFL
ncbi:hypothetical protein MLD38_003403 [Melastoma candidum]|uniref:Uncharacterized protein n=1 Tax=Melastoma candidum TaxID=119954 RepID=A0ACB9S3T6_9MYRT|nr:hypothetical protein MLD38_003403 [Melastoma candidum]